MCISKTPKNIAQRIGRDINEFYCYKFLTLHLKWYKLFRVDYGKLRVHSVIPQAMVLKVWSLAKQHQHHLRI